MSLFLVTGGSGSLGRAVVAQLRQRGDTVRVLVRREIARQPGLEVAVGDLADATAVDRAVAGTSVVIHCGAVMKGTWAEHHAGTVVGTQNVIDACKKHGVSQLVHISSMSVVDWAGSAGKGAVTEQTATEPRADERGEYTRAKLMAEQLVVAAAKQGLPAVILRPGQIFGGGIPLITGAVARQTAGRWFVLGDGTLELPLVYIDDVVDAVLAAVDKKLVRGELFQIIDPEHLTQNDVLALAGGNKRVIKIPRAIVFALGRFTPIRYRLQSALARLHYDSDHAARALGWTPRVGLREGIRRTTR